MNLTINSIIRLDIELNMKLVDFKSGVHFLSVVCGIARLELRHATTTKKVFLSLEL